MSYCSGWNSTSACTVSILNPRSIWYPKIPLKTLNISHSFLTEKLLTPVKSILKMSEVEMIFHSQRIYLL